MLPTKGFSGCLRDSAAPRRDAGASDADADARSAASRSSSREATNASLSSTVARSSTITASAASRCAAASASCSLSDCRRGGAVRRAPTSSSPAARDEDQGAPSHQLAQSARAMHEPPLAAGASCAEQ